MNKQEVIEEIRIRAKYDSEYRTSLIRSDKAIELIKKIDESESRQLDEPQKVKVPKCVAEWIEQAKKERQSLYEAMWNIESSTYYHKYDNAAYQWMFEGALHDEHQELFAEAYMYGYEVEESKWIVKRADGDYVTSFTQSLLNVNIDVTSSLDCASYYKFTDLKKAEALALLVDGSVEEV